MRWFMIVCTLTVAMQADHLLGQKYEVPAVSDTLLPIHENCGRENLLCRVGTQGPCAAGQTFIRFEGVDSLILTSEDLACPWGKPVTGCETVEEPTTVSSTVDEPATRLAATDESTTVPETVYESTTVPETVGESITFPPKPSGFCIWSREGHPCLGYPASFRYYAPANKCFPTSTMSEENPCPNGLVFYSVDEENGDCDCFDLKDIYVNSTNQCYPINSQGPCPLGQWLVFISEQTTACVETSCKTDGRHVLYKNPKTGVKECRELYVSEGSPCDEAHQALTRIKVFPEEIECTTVGFFAVAALAASRTHSCTDGSKLAQSGECKKVF